MRVKCVFSEGKYGFWGTKRVYDGDVLDVPDHLFSKNWMVKLDPDTPNQKQQEPIRNKLTFK